MKLLRRHNHQVLVLGLGVVGRAIFGELKKQYVVNASGKLNWSSLSDCKQTLTNFIADHISKDSEQIDIIWSAGKSGFSASAEEADQDLRFFEAIVDFLSEKIREQAVSARQRFILISSAGGLFEGQTGISSNSEPDPKRPYGWLKLQQEAVINSHGYFDEIALVRLSSVYTISNLSSRMGLIPTMVSKAIRQDSISIYGTETTLRDYVLDEDIGRYVVGMLSDELPGTVFVIDGKPYSIAEIKNLLESISGKKVYLKYALLKSNAANMSFSQSLRARGFKPSNLPTNLRLLYFNLLSGATQ